MLYDPNFVPGLRVVERTGGDSRKLEDSLLNDERKDSISARRLGSTEHALSRNAERCSGASSKASHSTRIFPQHSGVMSAQPCLIRGVATAELSESFTKTIADSAPGLAPGKGTIHLVTVTDGVITVYSATSGISGALHYPFCRLDKEFRFREQQMAMSESF